MQTAERTVPIIQAAMEERRAAASAEPLNPAEFGDGRLVQLSGRKIFAIWAAATLPMGAAAWIAAPLLASATGGTNALPKALLVTLSLGLVWQFLLVVGLIYREQGLCAGRPYARRCGCAHRTHRSTAAVAVGCGQSLR